MSNYYLKLLTSKHTGGWSRYKYPKSGQKTPLVEGPLVPCQNGYHVIRPRNLSLWIEQNVFSDIYLVKAIGETCDAGHKTVARQLKVIKRLCSVVEYKEMKYHWLIADGPKTYGECVRDFFAPRGLTINLPRY
jgi:hypothetical protein